MGNVCNNKIIATGAGQRSGIVRERIWNVFSDTIYLFDLRFDVLHPEKKIKRWFLRGVVILFSPLIVPLFLLFNIFDSVADFFGERES